MLFVQGKYSLIENIFINDYKDVSCLPKWPEVTTAAASSPLFIFKLLFYAKLNFDAKLNLNLI